MRKILLPIVLSFTMIICSGFSVLATEKTMPDGQVFDAEFYAANNPDVVAALGTDESVLYQHYVNFGQQEGRLPYASAKVVVPSAEDNNDALIEMAAWGYKLIAAREANNLNSGYLSISRVYTVDLSDPNIKTFYTGGGPFKDSPIVCIDYTIMTDNGYEMPCTAKMGKSTVRSLKYDQILIPDGSYITVEYTTNGWSSTWRYTNVTLLDANAMLEKVPGLSSSTLYNGNTNKHGLYEGNIKKL